MKSYTDHDINILLERYNHALLFDDAGGLEAALARAPKSGARRKRGRTVALLAACAVLLTLTVFAEDIVEKVREVYSFSTGSATFKVVDEIRYQYWTPPAGTAYHYSQSGVEYLGNAYHDYRWFDNGTQGGEGREAEGQWHSFATTDEVQALMPFPLVLLDDPAYQLSYGGVGEFSAGFYWERAYLFYNDWDSIDSPGRLVLDQEYVGPRYREYVQTTLDYQPITLLGVDGAYLCSQHEGNGVPLTEFKFVCNRLRLALSVNLPYDEALAAAQLAIEKAQAIDWDAVEAELAQNRLGHRGQGFLRYNPKDYPQIFMRRYHAFNGLAETQALVPYPLIELAAPNADFYCGTVVEYRPGCYYEGATLTYRQKIDKSDIRYYLYQQYCGPEYTGSLLGRDDEGSQPVTVLGLEGLWAPREPEKHSADPRRVEFRFLVNGLELHIDLPMGYDEALPLVEQVIRDAQAIDWAAVEAQLAR